MLYLKEYLKIITLKKAANHKIKQHAELEDSNSDKKKLVGEEMMVTRYKTYQSMFLENNTLMALKFYFRDILQIYYLIKLLKKLSSKQATKYPHKRNGYAGTTCF